MCRHVAIAAVATIACALICHLVPARTSARRGIGEGPGPVCRLPPRGCTGGVAYCSELVHVPEIGPGYVDTTLFTERASSYLRRDLMMLVQYAAATVACKAADWSTGNGGMIVLGDMSEANGATPGTRLGQPRHPPTTHVNGRAIDIAYYQRGTIDNDVRSICPYVLDGLDYFRCVAAPTTLDAWRTALFIGALLGDPRVRVVGVDGLASREILRAFAELCATKWIDPVACRRRTRIVFELFPTRRGWYFGHHTHFHVSVW